VTVSRKSGQENGRKRSEIEREYCPKREEDADSLPNEEENKNQQGVCRKDLRGKTREGPFRRTYGSVDI